MTKSYQIPAYFTFINWIIAVILGSLFIPITVTSFGNKNNIMFNEEYFKTAAAFAIVSLILSIPAIIIMFVSNLILNRQKMGKVRYLIIQNSVHIGVTLLTFLIIGLFVGGGTEAIWLKSIGGTYFVAGTIAWTISFIVFKEKQTEHKENEALIDEF